jgi:DNA-binding NtrC family response regulator
VILAGDGTIEMHHMPAFLEGGAAPATAGSTPAQPTAERSDVISFGVGTTVEEAEKGLILRTLEHTRNNKTRAAEILGISLKTLHNKLKEYGASKDLGVPA